MSEKHEIKVDDTAVLKVGRNEAKVKILKPMAGGNAYMVKSVASGKEFIVPGNRLNVPTVSAEPVGTMPEEVAAAPVPVEPETGDAPNPAPEAAPVKRMSLMDAAVAVLKESGKPMNTREMVKAATEKGYWTPTACKTPEQTLYGSIFRENKVKAQPRIVKSDVKGKFTIANFGTCKSGNNGYNSDLLIPSL